MNYLEEPLLLMNKAERDLLTMSEWMNYTESKAGTMGEMAAM